MATFEVTKETITVRPHPNADRLELATVGLYNVVVQKDLHKSGDTVLYVPEYAVLPENLIETMGLTGKLAGSQHNRVTPIKLRGELSQGLVMPLNLIPEGTPEDTHDYAPVFGIEKWQPEVPASMGGDVEANPELITWIDIENLKKFPDMFAEGEPVSISEKIHGSASAFTFLNPLTDETVIVTSKGLGEKKLSLKESESNVYWRVLHEYKLDEFARVIAINLIDTVGDANSNPFIEKVALFGETYGSKIQDLHYGRTNGNLGFALFDIFVEYTVTDPTTKTFTTVERWLNPDEVTRLAAENEVPQAPLLFEGPFDINLIEALASGKEQVSGNELHIREGVVVRPIHRGGYAEGEQKIGKFVSENYLLRKGGTEFQ